VELLVLVFLLGVGPLALLFGADSRDDGDRGWWPAAALPRRRPPRGRRVPARRPRVPRAAPAGSSRIVRREAESFAVPRRPHSGPMTSLRYGKPAGDPVPARRAGGGCYPGARRGE